VTLTDSHIENSKNHKKVILSIIKSPKCQCALEKVSEKGRGHDRVTP